MENSLFSINENYVNPDTAAQTAPPPPQQPTGYQPTTNNEAVLNALLSVSAGRVIMLDTSQGKKESLVRLAPQSRGLRKLVSSIETGGDRIQINGMDNAIEILDTLDDIVMNKFTIPTPLNV
ncbi:p12 [Helicoverpa armigera granulovirus]|uniref:p12 n=1 Tax=Helicoverpa armigera granulovirus TaxID=489830 RepID=A9YMT3_9BBAC|nr:p12 [Helicoverpa armigera granulovirus]ABY47782.1 p12 [Helicoverpa armigera granulovirus]